MHSFWVPALHGKVDLIPGQPNYMRIVASQAGEYKGQCAEFCGAEHARMRILAIAQTPDEYRCMARKANASPAPSRLKPARNVGKDIPCRPLLHVPHGPRHDCWRHGGAGPDPHRKPANDCGKLYRNNDAYLEAWITHAQSLKPGTQMPNLTQFSGRATDRSCRLSSPTCNELTLQEKLLSAANPIHCSYTVRNRRQLWLLALPLPRRTSKPNCARAPGCGKAALSRAETCARAAIEE